MSVPSAIPAAVIRYGVDVALPARQTLTAGPVTAVLENADLRYVYFGDTQLVLRLYMAVRDRNWSTIPATFTDFRIENQGDAFSVHFSAEHISADVDFAWSGSIEGSTDGTIIYRMDGAPRKIFLKNRIGFCVLHPMSVAGLPATVVTPEGTQEGEFPVNIAPDQPFIDMISISHPAGPDGRVTIEFEGDLFEVEDQRNWTDASFKTYGTPLRYPYPVEVTPETRITQSITITVSGQPVIGASGGTTADATLDLNDRKPLPPIGFGAGKKSLPTGAGLESFKALKAAHLWIDLDLSDDGWRERLSNAAASATELGVPIDLAVVAGENERSWDDLTAALKESAIRVGRLFAFPPVNYPIVFPRSDLATHPETVAAARSAFERAGIAAAIGGGTRAYFTELNRATGFLPVDQLDTVTYTINAEVHASDNLSVIETLAAQGETVRSARAIVGERELVVGPVTLKPPYNPNATSAPPPAGPDELPEPVDSRQLSLLAASWTLGSVHQLSDAGADALTYFDLVGWRGLREKDAELSRRDLFPSQPGQHFPLYHIFAALADFAGGEVIGVSLADGLQTEALAVRKGDRVRILIGGFNEVERQISVSTEVLRDLSIRLLDETTYTEASTDSTFFTAGKGTEIEAPDGVIALTLKPFAVACVDGIVKT